MDISQQLKEQVEGEIYTDDLTRHVYSIDASIFEIVPQGVIIPKHKEALLQALKILFQQRIPITARGAATGITGGCLGSGYIIDTSKYLHHILEINLEKKYVICEPGVVQDDLNQRLAVYGYRLGPDTSTGNRATVGGMLANNAAGARSLKYGQMVDHIQSVEIALADGQLVTLEALSADEWQQRLQLSNQEGTIYRTAQHLKNTYHEEIVRRYPPLSRRVSGYNLNQLLKPTPNLAQLIAGSEGTLGVITQMKLGIVPVPRFSGVCLIHFNNMLEGLKWVPYLLKFGPLSLEMIDQHIIEQGRLSPSLKDPLDWLKGQPEALFIFEIEGVNAAEVEQSLHHFISRLSNQAIGYGYTIFTDPIEMQKVWKLRQAGLGILLSKRTWSRALAFIEDLSIPPEHLASFMQTFTAYLQSKGKTAGIYGHIGSGCLHIRPYINLGEKNEYDLLRTMMQDVAQLVQEYGGTLSGEHGDGFIRSWLNMDLFGPQIIQAFKELKAAFDPHHLLNPGKIIPSDFTPQDLRTVPDHTLLEPKTFLDFRPEGGFALAIDLCNGNGQCRKKEGIMCPSFQVTNTEFHSTRARAQALRSIIHQRLPPDALTSHEMHAVMDLCISCKGCKTECPSQIDMTKMKSEFLYHYHQRYGMPLRSRLFGSIGSLNRFFSLAPTLFNYLNSTSFAKTVLEWIGITPQRPLPKIATERFSEWFKTYKQPFSNNKVILFNDTFTEFNNPMIGQAAIRLLNRLGYEAVVPPWSCCGRPALTKGLLKQAKKQASSVLTTLAPYIAEKWPLIGLEPSCLFTLRDDMNSFHLRPHLVKALHEQCLTLDEFLLQHIKKGGSFPLTKQQSVKVHGHCHQKALIGMAPTMQFLNALPNLQAEEIQAGCCGMAGSFGYEKEHYDISLKMGAQRLFPAVKKTSIETILIANGVSCRQQIYDGTGYQAFHLAEALLNLLT